MLELINVSKKFGPTQVLEPTDLMVQPGLTTVLIGPSGCGKSSAVRSGVIPAVRKGAIPDSDAWLIAQMVPGSNPFAELEAALLRSTLDAPNSLKEQFDGSPDEILRAVLRISPTDDTRVVIIVDQFEELFTLCDPDTSDRFLTALVEGASDPRGRVRVMVTLRADFYDRPLGHSQFGNAMGAGVVNVVPMTPRRTRTGRVPACATGWRPIGTWSRSRPHRRRAWRTWRPAPLPVRPHRSLRPARWRHAHTWRVS